MGWIFRKRTGLTKRTYPQQPARIVHPLSKPLVLGSILLVISAFILVKSHSITALILGVLGIAFLIAGATKQRVIPQDNTLLAVDKFCKSCGASCRSDWNYCAKCTSPLSNHNARLCPHCGLKTESGWKFCAHCTKELT